MIAWLAAPAVRPARERVRRAAQRLRPGRAGPLGRALDDRARERRRAADAPTANCSRQARSGTSLHRLRVHPARTVLVRPGASAAVCSLQVGRVLVIGRDERAVSRRRSRSGRVRVAVSSPSPQCCSSSFHASPEAGSAASCHRVALPEKARRVADRPGCAAVGVAIVAAAGARGHRHRRRALQARRRRSPAGRTVTAPGVA